MKKQLFIPKKCKVGFNLRFDTYTGKLGYVIAHDGKKWRKEQSWESWRNKVGEKKRGCEWDGERWVNREGEYGEEVNPVEFDNVPTSGFVLNKKVGGYKSDWNMRQTYSRVYDPRGFEFEINVPNLLYILQHANCMKGKGLEGEFLYSWDGKDLVLLPADAPEFKLAQDFTKFQNQKVSARDLVPGLSYKTKKEENVIYLGRFPWYEFNYYSSKNNKRVGKKKHIFYNGLPDEKVTRWSSCFTAKSEVSFLAEANSDQIVDNFAELLDKLKKSKYALDIVDFELTPTEIGDKDIREAEKGSYGNPIFYKENGGIITEYDLVYHTDYYSRYNGGNYKGYQLREVLRCDTKTREVKYPGYNGGEVIDYKSKEDLKKANVFTLRLVFENGKKVKVKTLSESL